MSTEAKYIVIGLIALVYIIIHIWREKTCPYMKRRKELDYRNSIGKLPDDIYEEEIKKLNKEMRSL
mgnify:CR=1 FL=1